MNRQRLRYGPHRANVADLWLPRGEGPWPTLALLHGAYGRTPSWRRSLRRLAADAVRRGWAAYNVGYRRQGFPGGDGWPATFLDVAAALDHLTALGTVDAHRVVVCGHSVGGQLALWASGRARLPADAPGAAPALLPRGAVALAGVVDLRGAVALGVGGGAVVALLGGTPAQVPDRYDQASPLALAPLGVRQLLVHGLDDRSVPPVLSERYAARAVELGDPVELITLRSLGHRAMIDPDRAGWQVAASRIAGWLGDPSGR